MKAWARTVGLGALAVVVAIVVFRPSTPSGPPDRPETTTTVASVGPLTLDRPTARAVYVSSPTGGSVGGVGFTAHDLLVFDTDGGRWSLYVDGTDLGFAASQRLDGFHVRGDGSVLFSLADPATLAGVGPVDGADVIELLPTGVGGRTVGSLSLYFDGSAFGLTGVGGNVDAVGLDPGGRLLLSTSGAVTVEGTTVGPEDVLVVDGPSLALHLDGSAVGLTTETEDVVGVSVDPSGIVHLLTLGQHRVSGLSGDGDDVLQCVPTTAAPIVGCDWSRYWDGEAAGFDIGRATGLSVTGAVNYFNHFDRPLGPEWVVYDSIGHAGWGLRRPSAVAVVPDGSTTGGGRLTITAEMGSGPETGMMVSGGVKLLKPQTYGRYTVRLKAEPDPDRVTSMVALLWPESNQWPRDGEIDIVETFRSRVTRTPVESTLHWLDPDARSPYSGADDDKLQHLHPGIDGTRWHTYVLEWRADLVSVSIDGAAPAVLSTDPAEIAQWNMEPTLQLDAFDAPQTPGRQPVISRPVTMSVDYILVQP